MHFNGPQSHILFVGNLWGPCTTSWISLGVEEDAATGVSASCLQMKMGHVQLPINEELCGHHKDLH